MEIIPKKCLVCKKGDIKVGDQLVASVSPNSDLGISVASCECNVCYACFIAQVSFTMVNPITNEPKIDVFREMVKQGIANYPILQTGDMRENIDKVIRKAEEMAAKSDRTKEECLPAALYVIAQEFERLNNKLGSIKLSVRLV